MRRQSLGLARQRRDARDYLRYLEQRARATGNPVFAWRAYTAARVGGLAAPEWVIAYFDDAADRVNALSHAVPRKGKIAPAIAAALGFTRKGKGRYNALAEAAWAEPALELAAWVAFARLAPGPHKLTEDWLDVAKAHGVSRSTVQKAWKKHGGDAAWGIRDA